MVKAVLHLGAHRCATTTFQAYLDLNKPALAQAGIGVWTPADTRAGLFRDLFAPPQFDGPEVTASVMRVQKALREMPQERLLVSEENMIGAPRQNLDMAALYPELTGRMRRYRRAFVGRTARVGLTIRSYENYWASLMAFAVWRGYPVPDQAQVEAISNQRRTWRHLVAELRALFPTAPIHVMPFEGFAHRAHGTLEALMGPVVCDLTLLLAKKNFSRDTKNLRRLLREDGRADAARALPQGQERWMPFSAAQQKKMQAAYAADIAWLRQCDDPYITFTDQAAAQVPPRPDIGDRYDIEQDMGRIGREGAARQAS